MQIFPVQKTTCCTRLYSKTNEIEIINKITICVFQFLHAYKVVQMKRKAILFKNTYFSVQKNYLVQQVVHPNKWHRQY